MDDWLCSSPGTHLVEIVAIQLTVGLLRAIPAFKEAIWLSVDSLALHCCLRVAGCQCEQAHGPVTAPLQASAGPRLYNVK
jgi:hypothetical protein